MREVGYKTVISMTVSGISSSLQWFWKVSKGIRLKAVINALLGILSVSLDFVFIWATKRSVDIATGNLDGNLTVAVAVLASSMLLSILIGYLWSWVSALLGTRSVNKMRLRTFSRLMHRVWSGRDDIHSGDIMNRLMTDSNKVTSVITDTVPDIVTVLFRLVGAFLFLFAMQPGLSVIVLVISPVFLVASKLYFRKMRGLSKDIRTTESKIQSLLQENLQNRVVVQTLEQTGEVVQLLSDTQEFQVEQIKKKTRFSSVSISIARIGFALGYLITFAWGVFGLQRGAISYGMMIAFIQLVGQIQHPFQSMMGLLPAIIDGSVSGDRLRELDLSPLESEGDSVYLGANVGVRLSDLNFTYDGKESVFWNFSYDFKPGSVTALMGETGSGKTTLFRLILSLVKPESGSVRLYNADEEVEASPQTRCNLVYVPQGNTLFSGTVRENLLLGNPDATDEQLFRVLRIACCDFILEDPDGLDKVCAEAGVGFSEGQAQRICIARSLLRKGSVLLLDESTSALDAATERRLIENLRLGLEERSQTVIFITHRSAILDCCTDVLNLS